MRLFLISLFLLFQPVPAITAENAAQLENIGRLGRGTANALDWHPDGTRLAVGSATGVWLLDETLTNIQPTPVEQHVTDLAWSPDGAFLALTGDATDDCTTQIWPADFSERRLDQNFCGGEVLWSPDGSYVAVFGALGVNKVMLIRVSDGKASTLAGQDGAWSPSGDILFTRLSTSMYYPERSKLYRWDVKNGGLFSSYALRQGDNRDGPILYGLDEESVAIICSPEGEKLGIDVCRWNMINTERETLETLFEIGTFIEGRCVCFSAPAWNADNARLAYIEMQYTPGFSSFVALVGSDGTISNLGDGELFDWRPASNSLTAVLGNGELRTYDTENGGVLAESHLFTAPVNQISVSPDSGEIASSAFGYGQDALVWDVNSPLEPRLRIPVEPAEIVQYTPGGELVAGGEIRTDIVINRQIAAFDPQTGEQLRRIDAFYDQGTAPPSRYWDAEYLAYASPIENNQLRLPNGVTIQSELLREQAFFSPDGTKIAVIERVPDDYSFNTTVWDVSTGTLLSAFVRDFMYSFEGLVWSPDSKHIAVLVKHPTGSGFYSTGVRVFSAEAQGEYPSVLSEYDVLAGVDVNTTHKEWAHVAWNSGGTLLAISLPGMLQIHRLENQSLLISQPSHGVTSLDWSDDDRYITAGHEDGTITLWGLPSSD